MTDEPGPTDEDLFLVARHSSAPIERALALVQLARRRDRLDDLYDLAGIDPPDAETDSEPPADAEPVPAPETARLRPVPDDPTIISLVDRLRETYPTLAITQHTSPTGHGYTMLSWGDAAGELDPEAPAEFVEMVSRLGPDHERSDTDA